MFRLLHFGFRATVIILCIQVSSASKQNSVNQNINQHIKGSVGNSVNQVISQNIDNGYCSQSDGSINQNINQDITNPCCSKNLETINQSIQQKLKHGSTSIERQTIRKINNHDKRSNQVSCPEEIIFERHHSKLGKSKDSSEEIKIYGCSQSSEIFYKNHEDYCGNLSGDSSEEIRIRYNCDKCKKKPCECQTSKEIVLPESDENPCFISIPVPKCKHDKSCSKSQKSSCEPKKCQSSEEIIIQKSRPYQTKSSEETCSKPKICVSREENFERNIFSAPKPCSTCHDQAPCECKKNSEEVCRTCSTPKPCNCYKQYSEEIIFGESKSCEDSSKEVCSKSCSKSKPCKCNEECSEEIIFKRPKPCGFKYSEESSIERSYEDISEELCETCSKPKPCNCHDESSEEMIFNRPKPCYLISEKPSEEIAIKPTRCSKEIFEKLFSKSYKKPYNIEDSSDETFEVERTICNKPSRCNCKLCDTSAESLSRSSEELIVAPACKNEDISEEIIVKPCKQKYANPCDIDNSKEYISRIVSKPETISILCPGCKQNTCNCNTRRYI